MARLPFREPRPDNLGEIHRCEPIGRVEVVLSRLIDNPHSTYVGGLGIGQNLVDLPDLQIIAPFVRHTDRKFDVLINLRASLSIQNTFNLHLSPAHAMGFVPM
jgi:hypothetical protein